MTTLLTILHIVVCLSLLLTVLLQSGKGGGMGAAFGGGGNAATVLGGSGASSFLRRLSAPAATVCMLASMVLAYLASHNSGDALEKFGSSQADLAVQKEKEKERALGPYPLGSAAGSASLGTPVTPSMGSAATPATPAMGSAAAPATGSATAPAVTPAAGSAAVVTPPALHTPAPPAPPAPGPPARLPQAAPPPPRPRRALLVVLATFFIPALAHAKRHPQFEPTDLELEAPGTMELDLQLGLVKGSDAHRVVLPDFEFDLGLLETLELDIDGTYSIAGLPDGTPLFLDHSAPDNLWVSAKIGLYDGCVVVLF